VRARTLAVVPPGFLCGPRLGGAGVITLTRKVDLQVLSEVESVNAEEEE